MSWQKPSNILCKQCGGYMVEKGKKLVCADKECGFVMDKEEVKQEFAGVKQTDEPQRE